MKTHSLKVTAVAAILAISVASCDKEVEAPEELYTPEDVLTSKSWLMTDLTLQIGDGIPSSFFHECLADNKYTFFKNGTYTLDPGSISCVENNDESDNGTWNLSYDGSELDLLSSNPKNTDYYEVYEMTKSTMIWRKYEESDLHDEEIIIELKFKSV